MAGQFHRHLNALTRQHHLAVAAFRVRPFELQRIATHVGERDARQVACLLFFIDLRRIGEKKAHDTGVVQSNVVPYFGR